MSLKKLIVNGLAVVGAVVVADKIVTTVCNKSTKAISEELLKKFSHDGHCCEDSECDEEENETDEKENDSTLDEDSFTDSDNDEAEESEEDDSSDNKNTYEFTVKAENITSEPKEV